MTDQLVVVPKWECPWFITWMMMHQKLIAFLTNVARLSLSSPRLLRRQPRTKAMSRVTEQEVMIDAYAIAFDFVVDRLVVQLAVTNIMYVHDWLRRRSQTE